MKKNKFLVLALALVLLLVGCTKGNSGTQNDDGKKKVTVTTTFLQDMVNVLAGDKVNTELIIPAGEDPHLYVAKPGDLSKIKDADLVLYHGLHFEGKMVDVLEEFGVNVTSDFSEEEISEFDQDGEMVDDPHFWFDLGLYEKAMQNAAQALIKLLPEEKETILENLNNYGDELVKLDKEIKEKLASIEEGGKYLVTPHDAFNYFSRAYGMEVIAPQGISTDSEVASSDIEKTAQFIVDHKIKAIFAESTTNPERMKKLQEIVKSKGFDVKVVSGDGNELFSDSLAPKGQAGDNFLDMYRHNVDLIVNNLK